MARTTALGFVAPAILTGTLLLSACATSGTKVDPATVAAFQRGVTTYDAVVTQLGPPTALSVAPDGSRVAVYAFSRVTTRAVSYVPVVGLFAGGADAHEQSAVLRFAPDGTFIDSSFTESQAGAHVGL